MPLIYPAFCAAFILRRYNQRQWASRPGLLYRCCLITCGRCLGISRLGISRLGCLDKWSLGSGRRCLIALGGSYGYAMQFFRLYLIWTNNETHIKRHSRCLTQQNKNFHPFSLAVICAHQLRRY